MRPDADRLGCWGASSLESTRNAPAKTLHTHTLTTIVVVDIRDFTPLARAIPEGLLSQAIGAWFPGVGKIAQERGSWAQKYIGDAMMAGWVHGSEQALRPDLAARALRRRGRFRSMNCAGRLGNRGIPQNIP